MIAAIVTCGNRKRDTLARADAMYTGPYHRKMLALARSRFTADSIMILSALHGFLPLNRIIVPYEKRWGEPGCVTEAQLDRQAVDIDFAPTVVVLAGQAYADRVARYAQVTKPLSGLMGTQMAQATRLIKKKATPL